MNQTDPLFVPPAAEGLPLAALNSATKGADRLDAAALTPTVRNFLAHALVQLARDGWLRVEPGEGFEPVQDREAPEPLDAPEPAPASSGGALRDRIAAAIWERQNPGRRYEDCEYRWRADAEEDADAVLAVLQGCTLRELEQLHRPNTTPSRPEPRRLVAETQWQERTDATAEWSCPTCGPVATEPHPRLSVRRCSNCKEHVPAETQQTGTETSSVPLATTCAHCGHRYDEHNRFGCCVGNQEVRCGCEAFAMGEKPEAVSPWTILGADAASGPQQPADESLVHVGWWCWRGDNHGHLATMACRSDNVPLHVPAEWADDMRAVLRRIEDGDDEGTEAAEAHPPALTWKIETPLRGEWRHTGATHDDHTWATERYQDAIDTDPAGEFRLVRATTTYTVEAAHNPAAPVPVEAAADGEEQGAEQ